MKMCAKCKISKEYEWFSISKHKRDGYYSYCKPCERERQQINKEKYSKQRKKYAIENAEHLNLKKKEYIQEHKQEKSEYDKIYREENAQKISNYKLIWGREQRKTNPEYRIKNNLRRRVIHALNGSLKAENTLTLLGCDIKFFKEHLEKQFYDVMTWENYGSIWHIDHIIPCASFELTKPEQQKKCFHYTNLQPLLKLDNLKKGCKIL